MSSKSKSRLNKQYIYSYIVIVLLHSHHCNGRMVLIKLNGFDPLIIEQRLE